MKNANDVTKIELLEMIQNLTKAIKATGLPQNMCEEFIKPVENKLNAYNIKHHYHETRTRNS